MYASLLAVVYLGFSLVGASNDVVAASISIPSSPTPINPRFAGYSFEYMGIPSVMGSYPNLNIPFIQFLNNIKEYTGAVPQFRIGGNSADTSWWNPDNLTFPGKYLDWSITPVQLATLQAVLEKLDTYSTLSVNMIPQRNATWAIEYVKAIAAQIGWDRIYAVEIGNEPDHYYIYDFRPSNYTWEEYRDDFSFYAAEIAPYLPAKQYLQGETYCCVPSFYDATPQFLFNESSLLKTISFHNYPLTHCGNTYPILFDLMQDSAAEGVAQGFASWAQTINNAGKELWIGEMNSASCGGAPNVSDVYGSALWAIDMLFNYANIGVKGVNFHGGNGGAYSSFEFLGLPHARPIYYGQYFFAQAIRANSVLVTSQITSTTNNYVKVWSVLDNDSSEMRVSIIHKDINTTRNATVTITIASSIVVSADASYVVLQAPAPDARVGISLAGQTFDNTTTGAPLGTYSSLPLSSISSNTFQIVVSPATAILITIPTK